MRIHSIHCVAAAALIAAAAPASAETWVNLGTDDDSTTAFLDTDSVVASGNIRTFTMKFTLPGVEGISYALLKHRVDCVARTTDVLHMTAYGKTNQIVIDTDDTEPARPIGVETNGEKLRARVCAMGAR